MKIEVSYDGKYPIACFGRLIIKVDEKEIYNKEYCCHSTGCVWFDEEWNDYIESGELIWDDANLFSSEIQKAVNNVLDKIDVCCGGCI